MRGTPQFEQYRGDGTTRDGRPVGTLNEKGRYLASEDLIDAVNAMLAVEQPLLVTGEPGTGKTMLAYSVAAELELEVELFTVRSDHQGRDLLYAFDHLERFYDAQVENERARKRENYVSYRPLGKAIRAPERRVVLIDEIDKAPRDFPNDLLHVLDRMELIIPETGEEVRRDRGLPKPIVIITSNEESQLPDAFLRRCLFHHIQFPGEKLLGKILDERLGGLDLGRELRDRIIRRFLDVREVRGLQKQPATSEMLTWARILERAGVTANDLQGPLEDLPFLGALLKLRQDLDLVKPKRHERERRAIA